MSMFTEEQNQMLNAKLDTAHIVKAAGGNGPKGDYIEGWFVIQEANRIFGHDGWSMEVLSLSQCHEPYQNQKDNWCVGYICTIRVIAGDTQRQDVGYGSGISRNIGDAHEGATKEAVTDALKRALRTFGNPFGLALYDKSRANVEDVSAREAAEATKAEARPIYSALLEALRQFGPTSSLPDLEDWAKKQAEQIKRLPPDWQREIRSDYTEIRNEIKAAEAEKAAA